MTRPLIGVTTSEVRGPELINPQPEGEPPQLELALGMPYVRALARAGAIPVVLPPLAAEVRVEPGSRLAHVVGGESVTVNSFHHQAVERLGEGLRAVAWAQDGTIEGIEAGGGRLVLGVQWHAETLDSSTHAALFEALVEAARPLAAAA